MRPAPGIAEQVRRHVRAELATLSSGSRELGADLTWSALWDLYAAAMAPRLWWRQVCFMMKPTLAHFGPRRVLETKRSDWTSYRDVVAASRTTHSGTPPAPATLNHEMRRLKAACNWAIQNDLLARNPLQGVKPLKSPRRDTIISDQDFQRLVQVLSPMMLAMVTIAMDSGMRVNEIRLLRWDEIDWERCRVNLAAARTKTRKARSPRLSARALAALKLMPVISKVPYVFANTTRGRRYGQPYTHAAVNRLWRKAVDQVGLKPAAGDTRVHFHDLRRSAITRMIRLGTPILVAMRAAGHSSASETWRYTTVGDEDLDEMKRKIDESVVASKRVADKEKRRAAG